jgi:drug/metabolite transporter (DMT)-like permease
VAIGAAAIFARFALDGAGPLAVAALRLGIATIVVLGLGGIPARVARRRELVLATAGLALAIHFAAWIASLLYTSVAVSTLLVTTTPIWTELYDTARKRRAPSRAYLVALGLAFGGIALIAFGRPAVPPPIAGHALYGDGLALVGSIAIGAYLILVRSAGANTDGTRMPTRAIVTRTYAAAAFVLVVLSSMAHQSAPSASNVSAWGGILAMALVSQLLGHTALNAALRDYTPSIIAMTTLLEPVVAAILAAWIFHETVSWRAATGGVLVLAAIALTLRGDRLARPGVIPNA